MPKLTKNKKSAKYRQNRIDEIVSYVDQTGMEFFDLLQDIYKENRQAT